MDLTPDILDSAVLPTAAFAAYQPPPPEVSQPNNSTVISWLDSSLNPKNRIDSLAPLPHPNWRIDGCSGLGTQFQTIPVFLSSIRPLRIDTFIPDPRSFPPQLRSDLEVDCLFHSRDARVAKLGISQHILRALEHWTSGFENFRKYYESLPFGSRICFQNMATNVRDIRIEVAETYSLERQLLSVSQLQRMWNLPDSMWPESVDIPRVHLVRQIYDSVGIVEVQGSDGVETVAFKALSSFPKFLYHELKILLTMPPHRNIIGKPHHLITKKCGFGGKIAVIGFTTTYHHQGSLSNMLPIRHLDTPLYFQCQLKWAMQITSALIHIHEQARRSYSDLRLENILLSGSDDVVMVDFEQRGLWCSFAAPEVSYLDYIHILSKSNAVPPEIKAKYDRLLREQIHDPIPRATDQYENPEHGYFEPWLCLSSAEKESAEVYMLGRVLWCIFEGLSCPETPIWISYEHESQLEFPNFRRTPEPVRELIAKCTASSWSWIDRGGAGGVVRRENKLVRRSVLGGQEPGVVDGPQVVQEEAKRWWSNVLEDVERLLKHRKEQRKQGQDTLFGRPTLREVQNMLEDIRCKMFE